jgi:hypothetical protein
MKPSNGALVNSYEIYRDASGSPSTSPLFSKCNGLGEVELLSDAPSIEIGNRVWNDMNGNGIQDAGESGLSGVEIQLVNAGGTIIANVSSASDGSYYFISAAGTNVTGITYGVNIQPFTSYTVRIKGTVNNNNNIAGNAGLNNSNYLTLTKITGNGQPDFSDNDAAKIGGNGGKYEAAITTGNYGDNNHNIDFGFSSISVLPVKLESFTAMPQGNQVMLSWKVSEEINVEGYTVEFSRDGSVFSGIGNLRTNISKSYSFLHSGPGEGFNYYRLKITDKDGMVSYSEIKKVNVGKGNTVLVYPGLANEFINITVTGALVNKKAMLLIMAEDGKIMMQNEIQSLNQTEVRDVSRLANGKYILRILSGQEDLYRAFEIIH